MMRGVARHHSQNWLRKHQETHLSLEEIAVEMRCPYDSVEDKLIQQEELDKIFEAISELPKTDRALMQDFYLEDLPYKALQQRHNLSKNAVNMRLIRARQKVRKRVEKILSGIVVHWRDMAKKPLVGGGLEVMKLSVKTKFMASGVGALLVLVSASVLIWQTTSKPESGQGQTSNTATQAEGETKAISATIAPPVKETPEASPKDVEKAIAFLDKLGEKQDLAAIGSEADEKQGDSEGREKLSPELKHKVDQYAKLAAILPQLREVKKRVGKLCKENMNYSKRRNRLAGTPDAISEEEQSRFFEQSDREIRAGIAEEKVYYAQIDDMFPELELYEVYYDDTAEEWNREQYAFHGVLLLEYFGRKLPWDGKSDYFQAEMWDGNPNWRPE
jgi:hypothetical protein